MVCEYCNGYGCARCVEVCYKCGKPHAEYFIGETTYCESCYYDQIWNDEMDADALYELQRDRADDAKERAKK